jgi:hypothetical protein
MPRSGWGRTLIAIFIGGVLASAVTVLPAVGQDSPPHPVVDIATGRLVAKGAAVNVPVTYTCGPGDLVVGYLYVELSQRTQQGRLARGYGYTNDIICDGTPQTVILQVAADTYFGGVAFKSGVALATVTLVVRLEGFTTEVESVQEEIACAPNCSQRYGAEARAASAPYRW